MGYNNQQKDALSINRFRDKNTETLTNDEFLDFGLAKLMQSVIQRLEGSIQNDRIYNRTKFDVMAAFWEAREELRNRIL